MPVEPPVHGLTPLQSAVYQLKQARAQLAACKAEGRQPIAVVGMACRFPGAASAREFWDLLLRGGDGVREVPSDRWDADAWFDPDPSVPARMNTRWGGFLDRVDEFDPEFFGMSPREAARVDPQHRLLLEICWEALEDAGIAPPAIALSRTGVYVGVIGNDYALLQSDGLDDIDVFSGTGCSHAVLANRVSYVLNLRGPSLALDTACSSSLVTVHLACQSLRRGETDLALAGGVNLILSPEMTLALTKAHMMAPDGRCRTFDAAASGYVRGEGCGMVVLKRLSDAQAAGDRVLGILRGSAVNHDGRSNGLSAPNGPAQEAVIRAALEDAGLGPLDISYVEAHGTGTRLGDPIEIEALSAVLGRDRPQDQALWVGSVKTNIGHLESAAGIAGLIKVLLMLRHGTIPRHLHLRTINPLLRLDSRPIRIPAEAHPWVAGTGPRRAGVSSFGFGGANAHVVLEEPPRTPAPARDGGRPLHILALSARSEPAVLELTKRYAGDSALAGEGSLADVAFSANTGRAHLSHRVAVIAASRPEARRLLEQVAEGAAPDGVRRGVVASGGQPRIAFLFTGQGAQYAGMGQVLYATQPTFRRSLDRCAETLDRVLDRPLLELLGRDAGAALGQTAYTQPALFALEYALATLWRSWGVEPTAVMGHSVGEVAAACVAGVLELEDGLRLIAERGRLMQSLPGGGRMAAVLASPTRVAPFLDASRDQVCLAAINGPESVVVSGAEPAFGRVLAALAAEGVKVKPLNTSHAFHSHLVDPVLEPLRGLAASLAFRPPRIRLVSNLTGRWADPQTYADPGYWAAHARQPVRFHDGIRTLADSGCDVFLEVGPGPVLIGMGQRCVKGAPRRWLTSLCPGRDEWQTMLETVADLYVSGAAFDWKAFEGDSPRRRVPLPTYPFQRQRYWSNSAVKRSPTGRRAEAESDDRTEHPLLGRRWIAAVAERVFESRLSVERPPILADHRIQGVAVMPGAAYLEMALAASAAVHGRPWVLRDVSFARPLLIGAQPTTLQTILSPPGGGDEALRIASLDSGAPDGAPSFTTHATGRIEPPGGAPAPCLDIAAQRARFGGEPFDQAWREEALLKSGLEPGPSFCWAHLHWVQGREALAQLRTVRDSDHASGYCIHPGLLDGALQLLGAALPGAGTGIDAFVPVAVGRLRLHDGVGQPAWCLASLTAVERDHAVGNITMSDADGRVFLEVEALRLQRVPRNWLARLTTAPLPDWVYGLTWQKRLEREASSGDAGSTAGRWLVLGSRDGLGVALVERLTAMGQTCDLALPPDADSRRAAVLRALSDPAGAPRGIILLSGLDAGVRGGTSAPDLEAARRDGWGAALDVVQAVCAACASSPPRLWLVTRGAQAVGESPHGMSLAQSPLWGLGRVIAVEHPELSCTRIDLDPDRHSDEAGLLAGEILRPDREDQIALRRDAAWVPRLRPASDGRAGELRVPQGRPYRLEVLSRGQLEQLELRPVPRLPPGPGQVEIEVRATGLNFRDVLNVLGLYPGDPGPLGGECAGEITAVGAGVENVKPGDAVLALAPACFSRYAVTLAEFVMPMPPPLRFEQAAAIPVCFLTAHYALCVLGRMKAGDRVLIHAATGGVGMAAIQLARRAGATIFATAGSASKRQHLQGLGIEHVMDSRSVDFAAAVSRATAGEGVDLVLNSLTGEAIAAGLSALRPGGRFLELGKTDLWDQARVDAFRPGIAFHAIALDRMMAQTPLTVRDLMRDVVPRFAEGKLTPPPIRAFPIRRAVDAFRHMARAEHIGKIVVIADGQDEARPSFAVREDGTYLVTGGLGGLGISVARWLVRHGARNLILAGRSAPSETAAVALREIARGGVQVAVRACDVSRREEVAGLLASTAEAMPPLRGVFHLAGVLDDGVLREQTRERFDRVMAAKVLGAWNLHELTAEAALDCFVLFSSAAALLGSPGQGNYAAANAFLDALADQRRKEGRPALSVNWGAWADAGMAARLSAAQTGRWSEGGIGWIEPDRGLRTLEELLADGAVHAGVLPVNWARFFERIPPGAEPAWLDVIAARVRSGPEPAAGGPPVLLEKLKAAAAGERLSIATAFLGQEAARVLAMAEDRMPDPQRPLNELGFDSLTGVEFCNRIARAIGQHLNPMLLFDYPTLALLAGFIVRDLLRLECDPDPAATPAAGSGADNVEATGQRILAEIEGLSDEQIDSLVSEHLDRMQSTAATPDTAPPPIPPQSDASVGGGGSVPPTEAGGENRVTGP